MMENSCDVAVVGGSFAGLSAALMLGRARRRAVVFDTGLTRNRFASHGHGVIGLDHRAPAEIVAAGRADLARYPTVQVVDLAVTGITGGEGAFALTDAEGRVWQAKRVILAHGMRDILPDLPGLAEGWGHSVLQCPYCHGFEAADLPTAVLLTHPGVLHIAQIVTDLTADMVLFANGQVLAPEVAQMLAARGIAVEPEPVVAVEAPGGALRAVVLEGGRRVPRAVLYLTTRTELSVPFAADLGAALEEGPFGRHIKVDMLQRASIPGLFAAGDITRPHYGAPVSLAEGNRAGAAAHQSLLGLLPPMQ